MADTLKKVDDAEKNFKDLWERNDSDAKLAYLDTYTLQTTGKKDIPNVVSVTMNDPAIFLNAIVSLIMAAVWQTEVEGDLPGKQKMLIENFLNDCWAQADERYKRRARAGLLAFFANHICVRGWIGAKWLFEGEERIPLCQPVDMRYCPYEMGPNGPEWIAPKTWRSKAAIRVEYDKDVPRDDTLVIDFWDGKINEVWIEKEKVLEQENPFGRPPFEIQAAPAGFMLLDKGYMVHEGESIFFLDRDLYPEYNRIISIDQTLAMKAIMPPYQKPADSFQGDKPSYPDGVGTVTEVLKGEEYQLIQRPDVNMASRSAHANISGAVQRGGVNNIDLGNVGFETSAVWITEQSEIRGKLVKPRLEPIASFCELLARMIITQAITLGVSGKLGRLGRKNQYSSAGLGDTEEYTITYKLMSKDKKQEIANLAMAGAAKGTLSRDTIIRDILVADDPEGEIAKIEAEEAEELDPAIKYFRRALSAVDVADSLHGVEADAKRMESMMLTEAGVALLAQRGQGEEAPKTEDGKPDLQALVPLLGKRGAGGGRPPKEVIGGNQMD